MNMVLRKRHIILASLVLALGVAVYLNYQFAQSGTQLLEASASQPVKHYGDAQFVDKPMESQPEEETANEYFTAAKLNRQQSRDEAVETLGRMIAQEGMDRQQKDSLTMQAAKIAQAMEKESKIENLVKAKGFAECMVYLEENKANVCVQTGGLLPEEAAQIKEILLKEAEIPVENIAIVEVN